MYVPSPCQGASPALGGGWGAQDIALHSWFESACLRGGGAAEERRGGGAHRTGAGRPGVQAGPGDLPPLAWGPSLLSGRRAAESRPLPLGTWASVCLRRLGRAPRVAETVTHPAPRPRWNAHVRRGPEGTPATPPLTSGRSPNALAPTTRAS